MGNKKKNIINITCLCLLIIITFSLLLKGEDIPEMIQYMKSADREYVFLAMILSFTRLLGEGVCIYILLKSLREKTSFLKCFKYSAIGFLFCAITPSASGGQPAQVFYMKQEGVSVARSSLVLVILTIVYRGVLVAFGLGTFWYLKTIKYGGIGSIKYLFYAGMIINLCIFIFFLFILSSRRVISLMTFYFIEFLHKIHLIADVNKVQDRFQALLARYHEGADYLKDHINTTISVIFINIVQRICMFSTTYAIYRAFHLEESTFIHIILLQSMVAVCADMLPLPGGVGANEKCYTLLFANIFGPQLLIPSMLLIRGFGFYLLVAFSGIITVIVQIQQWNKRKAVSNR